MHPACLPGYVLLTLALGKEGMNGWRLILRRALLLAKRWGYGLVTPCVKDSQLVCCFEGDNLCDVDPRYKFAVKAAEQRMTRNATMPAPRRDALDVTTYFDADMMRRIAPHMPPQVAAPCLGHLTFVNATTAFDLATTGDPPGQTVVIHDARKGIFALGGRLGPQDFELEAAQLLRLTDDSGAYPLRVADPLDAVARAFLDSALGGTDYDVLLWRSEMATAFNKCSTALVAKARTLRSKGRTVVFVGDLDANDTALWRPNKRMRSSNVVAQLRDLGVKQLDHWLKTTAQEEWDLGSLGLVDQLLAARASTLYTQRKAVKNYKVHVGPCGWEGRFITTILAARAHHNRTTLSWA